METLHSQFTNVVFSTLFSHASRGDACTAYFLSIFVDCTLGVLIIYSTLRIFSYVLIQRMHLKGFRSGQYYEKRSHTSSPSNGSPENDIVFEADVADHHRPSLDSIEDGRKPASTMSEPTPATEKQFQWPWWGKQLLVYLASLVVMKLAILGFFWIPAVLAFGDWLLSWLGEDTKIVFVLMIFPLAMNALQFLLIDTILKSKTPFSESGGVDAEGSMYSRGPSEDGGLQHGGDDEEGRAFLLSSAHQGDLEAGLQDDAALPAYLESRQFAKRANSPSVKDPIEDGHSQSQTSWSHLDEEDDEDFTPTPKPTSRMSRVRSTSSSSISRARRTDSAIPLRVVPSHERRTSDMSSSSDQIEDVTRDTDRNGWDWLSEDGASSNQEEDDDGRRHEEDVPSSAHQDRIPSIKTAKLA